MHDNKALTALRTVPGLYEQYEKIAKNMKKASPQAYAVWGEVMQGCIVSIETYVTPSSDPEKTLHGFYDNNFFNPQMVRLFKETYTLIDTAIYYRQLPAFPEAVFRCSVDLALGPMVFCELVNSGLLPADVSNLYGVEMAHNLYQLVNHRFNTNFTTAVTNEINTLADERYEKASKKLKKTIFSDSTETEKSQ